MSLVVNPYSYFTDTNGNALNGYLYVGEVGKNAENYPIAIFYDNLFTTPAPNPLTVSAGYIYNGGTIAQIYASVDYSIVVKKTDGSLVYSSLNETGMTNGAIANIDEMKDFVAPYDNYALNVLGNITEGDGEGGAFYYDASSTATADDINIIEPTSGSGRWIRVIPLYTQAYTIETVNDFDSIPSGYTTAIVKDIDRGGTFIWSSTGTANDGTVFAGATGYWNRQYSGAVNVKWFGAKGDGVTDDTTAFQNALVKSKNIYIPAGTYIVSDTLILTTGTKFIGQGRRGSNLTTIYLNDNTKNLFTFESNGRVLEIKNLNLSSVVGGTNSCFEIASGGLAESNFDELTISGFQKWVNGTDLYWNNTHTNIRVTTQYGIYLFGVSGSNIQNHFENVYFDNSGDTTGLAVAFYGANIFTTTFLKCNFGGSYTGGRFIVISSGGYGTSFVGCNFEGQRVTAGGSAFTFTDRVSVTFESCTFADIDELGSGAAIILLNGEANECHISNCEIVNGFSANIITYTLNVRAAKVTINNSPYFADESKHYYWATTVYPDIIQDLGSVDKTIESITYSKRGALTYGIVNKEMFTHYITAGGLHDFLTFTHGTPIASDDSTVIAGEIHITFAGRNDAGARTNGFARFAFTYNNDGALVLVREIMQSTGYRTVDIALTQSTNVLQLTITPNLNNISGGRVSAVVKFTRTKYSATDITVAFNN